MEKFRRHWTKAASIGGGVISIISLASFGTWRDGSIGILWAFRDNPFPSIALLVGIVLLFAGNWDRVKSLVVHPQRWKTDKDLGDELNGWMRDAGWAVQNLKPHPGAEGKVGFGFAATDDQQRIVNVTKAAGIPVVVLVSGIEPAAGAATVVDHMTDEQKGMLVEDLGLEMARFGLGFKITSNPKWEIQINDAIVVTESLIQTEFFDRVTGVVRALVLAQITFTRRAREAQRGSGVTTLVPVPQSSPDMEDSPTG
jgi:hypothetical protein